MHLRALHDGKVVAERVCYSIGGGEVEIGELSDLKELLDIDARPDVQETHKPAEEYLYAPLKTFRDFQERCMNEGIGLPDLVFQIENGCQEDTFATQNTKETIEEYLWACWLAMRACVEGGLARDGVLAISGNLRYPRIAAGLYEKTKKMPAGGRRDINLLRAFALAASEQNADALGDVVTAPTCGACGVLPGVLYFYFQQFPREDFQKAAVAALAVAGVVGNVCRANASISGAECGCQAEVGVAEAMSAAAACYLEMHLQGGFSVKQSLQNMEHAARISLKNKLGLTCDPVLGLVIDPCIQRNGAAAVTAYQSAVLSCGGEFDHLTNFDAVVQVMRENGQQLSTRYKETASGGLAAWYAAGKNRQADLSDEIYSDRGNGPMERARK